MATEKEKVAIFLVPRSSKSWKGAEALWITVAGWASAAEKRLGTAVVITTDRISYDPRKVLDYPFLSTKKEKVVHQKRQVKIPQFLRVLAKDFLHWLKSRTIKHKWDNSLNEKNICFVWEQHDLFPGAGKKISRQLKIPLVKYVHAPVVWEAAKWGVKRYFWGGWLEKLEARSLRQADLVAVVSAAVKEKLLQMKVPDEKIVISPMAVDPSIFRRSIKINRDLKHTYGIKDQFVIGWTGSFRKFHGLEDLVFAFRDFQEEVENSILLLIGDGSERQHIEELVTRIGLREKVVFTGKKKFLEIPAHLSLFDIAVVSAKNSDDFHYSPLKLREYMAAGKAILAPDAGDIPKDFNDEDHIKLFKVGNISNLKEGMLYLFHNKDQRRKISENGRKLVLDSGTWDVELRKVLKSLRKKENDSIFRSSS